MPLYLSKFSYTPETWARMINNPEDRGKAAQAYIDWALTPEAQNIGTTVGSYQALTHPDAQVDDRMVQLDSVNLVDYDFAEAAAQKPTLTARFDAEIASQPRD